jgi:adenylosuccinate synthase
MGQLILQRGNEFGATTGRPRRCGWFDAVAVNYACRINGIRNAVLTKPDVLDGLEEIQVCVGYKYKGERLRTFPPEIWILEKIEPQFKKVRGWKKPVKGLKEYDLLPQAFKDYVKLLEDLLQVKISLFSTGMERGESILIEDDLRPLLDLEKIKAQI